jgi:nickel superoxide dismutase
MLIRHAFAILNRILPAEDASAHCDIPCGIYDPHLAQIGALTVVRMNQLIEAYEDPAKSGQVPPKADRDKYISALARYIAVKEEHAELVKHEVRIIRGDFFKPDNSPANIGELVDGIMKLASKCRQNVDMDAAQQLLAEVQKFAEAFWKAKGVTTKRQPSNQAVGEEMVLPAA